METTPFIDALFRAWLTDIDSVPFAHEHEWTYPVGDPKEGTP